jgi:hypothetical protein
MVMVFSFKSNMMLIVTSHGMVLSSCVQRQGMKISMGKVHRYQCTCKNMLLLRHKEEYFIEYQNIVLAIQQTVLCMENISWKIFRDTC